MAKWIETEHPHIVRAKDIYGGEPIVKGTRTPVRRIVEYFQLHNGSLEEVLLDLPHLSLAQIHDALSYYHDHPEEIEKYAELNKLENVLEKHDLVAEPVEDNLGILHQKDGKW